MVNECTKEQVLVETTRIVVEKNLINLMMEEDGGSWSRMEARGQFRRGVEGRRGGVGRGMEAWLAGWLAGWLAN